MIAVILIGPDGSEFRLDTPDPSLIGPWLKTIFDTFQVRGTGGFPVEFRIRISA